MRTRNMDRWRTGAGLALLCSLLLSSVGQGLAGEGALKPDQLRVLPRPRSHMMKDYLTALVDEQFARRKAVLASLESERDWTRHAEFIRASMRDWSGPFPRRTPLNVRITGTIERQEYSLLKILFESRPGFLVSATLHLPKRYEGRRPAVLNVIGHSAAGKATEKVQRRAIAQARRGFVALTIDALGQGERQVREYSRSGRPPGNAHQIIGTQAFLAGTHVFQIMVWDVIRAIDYLVSRSDVDPDRIACTGCSGGGMMTTYVLPFESRIKVAVPACNPNTWSHRVHANLATDHEQVFFGAFAAGIDPRGDPLFCHVPKPLLINATSQDSLNPTDGVWELNAWLEKAYAAHGNPDRFNTSMIDGPHGYSLRQREIAYEWMMKWLTDEEANSREQDFAVEAERDTWCTEGGNVYADEKSRHPHALVLDYLRAHRTLWPSVKSERALGQHKTRLRSKLEKLLALPNGPPVPDVSIQASSSSGDLELTSIILKPEEGIILPGLWIESRGGSAQGSVLLYLHDGGKENLANEAVLDRLVLAEGYRILAVDLRGMGETSPSQEGKFWDFLAGRPILSQRVSDVLSILSWLSQTEPDDQGVHVWAYGTCSLFAAFAAALDDTVVTLVLEEPLLCYESVVSMKVPTYRHEIMLPGVLEHFDLPHVYQALLPSKVTLINPLRGDKSPASQTQAAECHQRAIETYESLQQADAWRIHTQIDERRRSELLLASFARARGDGKD